METLPCEIQLQILSYLDLYPYKFKINNIKIISYIDFDNQNLTTNQLNYYRKNSWNKKTYDNTEKVILLF